MATARTKADALGFYASDPSGLGGIRSDFELSNFDWFVATPIGPIIVQRVTGLNTEGEGTIRAASTTTLAYTAPGDTEGTAVTVGANTSVLLESGTPAKAVRVYRDSVYNANVLGGSMTLDLRWQTGSVIAGPDTDENGENHYACVYIKNHSDANITSLTISPRVLGTANVVSDVAQLGATGGGTITTSATFPWPTSGWVKNNTTGEVCYYTSRTGTSLTIPAAGRGIFGTTLSAGGASDTLSPVAPIRLWMETPTNGEVQTIANSSTSPTSPTWSYSETVATLTPGEERALWIHRHVPAGATVNTEQLTGVRVAFTYSATAYTSNHDSYFRIGDTTLDRYELHVGEDAAPTYTTATATSTTLPFTQALSTSTTSYYVTRKRNQFNLASFNVLSQHTVTDGTGQDITETLTDPTVVSIDSQPGGEVDLTLYYNGSADLTKANTWRLYITTDGTTPNVGSTPATDTAMQVTGLGLENITQTITLGPYDYGTVVKLIARTANTDDSLESSSTTVTTETVDTQVPVMANWMSVTTGGYRGHGRIGYDSTVYYNDPTNTVGIQTMTGEMVLFGATEALRAVLGNSNEMRTTLSFSNVAHSTSGTATPIEVVDANTFYINVNSTRRAKIDLTGGTIEASSFVLGELAIDLPVIGPTHTTTTETYLMVFNGITGRWTPAIKVDSSGVFTTTADVLQEN